MNIAPVEIHSLTPGRLADFLAFFEGPAFADNPKWRSCYCQFLYVDHSKIQWMSRTGEENKAAACGRIASDRMRGLLAYRQGRVVGWCNAAPRTMLDAFADEPDPDAARIGQITCFVVAKEHRRSGVATELLSAACAALQSQGMSIAEAAPKPEIDGDAENHFGPMSMFLAAGFQIHKNGEHGSVHVRKSLA
jgi:ribosomal protein S18 acetylase RimI-like enzyme